MSDTCKFCGCTDDRACPGGCHWVGKQYCSACRDTHIEKLAEAADTWLDRRPEVQFEEAAKIGEHPCRIIVEPGPTLSVRDHLSVVVFELSDQGVMVAPNYAPAELLSLFDAQEVAA